MEQKKPIKPTTKLLLIVMASIFSLSLITVLLFFIHHHNHHQDHLVAAVPLPEIQQACKATRYPQPCEISLAQANQLPPNPNSVQIIQSSILVSSENLKTAQKMVQSVLNSSAGNFNITNTAKLCLEALGHSDHRIKSTAEALPRGGIKDARMWMSAGLSNQFDCRSGFSKFVNDSQVVNQTVSFMDSLINSSSNALSMLMAYDVFGNQTGLWVPPRTERDGFWEGVGGSGDGSFKGGLPVGITPNVTVCKGGACTYKTVQEAVDATPSDAWRFVIGIKEGVYEETVRIPLDKKNVVFLGDGMGKTVITGSKNVGQIGVSTWNTATVGVRGDGFMASGLTIENTAGPDAHQAVAFASDSDLSYIENCEFLGNQDTLYAHSLRQFYKSCRIEGNVDFIFGNSASIFQDCQILVRPRQLNPEKGEDNAVAAVGRTDPAQSTGFVFQNCVVNGTDKYMELYYSNPKVHRTFLGRPWKEFSRTVFINCYLEALVSPQGWMPWTGDFALQTLYYGEFNSSGSGGNSSQRVTWSSQIPADHVYTYSLQNFIQGDEWIPTS